MNDFSSTIATCQSHIKKIESKIDQLIRIKSEVELPNFKIVYLSEDKYYIIFENFKIAFIGWRWIIFWICFSRSSYHFVINVENEFETKSTLKTSNSSIKNCFNVNFLGFVSFIKRSDL